MCLRFKMEHSNVSKDPKMRKTNKKMFIAKQVLGDFMENTSVHGIKYLVDGSPDDGRVTKLFWTSVLVLAFVGSGLMLKLFWNRYQARLTLSVVESFYAPSFLAEFPALTACPMIPPERETLWRLLEQLRLPDSISRDRAHSLLKDAFEMSHPRAGMDNDRVELDEILTLNGLTLLDLLKTLKSPCKDVVESCWWERKRTSCVEIFRLSYTFGGLCCSFNYLLQDRVDSTRNANASIPFREATFGVDSGLTLIFKANQFVMNHENGSISRITTNTIGLLLFIHNSMAYPDSSSLILQAGREMQLRVTAKEIRRVPGVNNENEYSCAVDGTRIKYFPEYWRVNCYNSCRMRAAMALCGCIPWLFGPFAENDPICGFSQMKCLRENYRNIWSVMYLNESVVECYCPTRCYAQTYRVTHTQIPIAGTFFAASPLYRNISIEKAVLRMYTGEQVHDKGENMKIADEIYLLSSVGGIFSLFLGCSILSLVEIIYFGSILIANCVRKKSRISHA